MMNEECLNLHSSFVAKKLCCERVNDRISELPDEIIVVILSFMSLRSAVKTSVLSTRWSDLWKHTPKLNFRTNSLKLNDRSEGESSRDVENCKYIQMVNTVIDLHKAPSLKKFRIYSYVNKKGKSEVTKWLEFAFSRKVERLELKFRWYAVIDMIVLGELLRESRVSMILFKSLKFLYLKGLKVSGEDIKLFLHSFPLLEQLVIKTAGLLSDIEVCGTTDLKLKHLDISYCFGAKSVKVSAPNLTWIKVDDKSRKLSIENVPELKDMWFRVTSGEYVAQQFASVVSCFISQLQYLTLILHHPKEFLANGFPRIPKLKELVVLNNYRVFEQGGLLVPIAALIRASPRLQVFVLQFFGELKDATSYMEVTKKAKRCRHRCLKVFEFQGSCRGIGDHIVKLMTYISNNCVALQKIIIGRPFNVMPDVAAEVQARDILKQQLQGKLRDNIRLQFLEII